MNSFTGPTGPSMEPRWKDEVRECLAWCRPVLAWTGTVLVILLALVFFIALCTYGCEANTGHNARVNRDRARQDAEKAFYRFCARRIDTGAPVPDRCPP